MQNDKHIREIDETALSASSDRFQEILDKVKKAGARIDVDEESPLYVDVGAEEIEIGTQREVQFNLNGNDFLITRQVKMARISGSGYHKHKEDLEKPIVDIKLNTKPEISDQWVAVDLDDMFN